MFGANDIIMKYANLQHIISKFFKTNGEVCDAQKGCEVSFSPWGSTCGPDLLRCTLVGEIKYKVELDRDLSSRYWSSWNSPNGSHGGKPKGYVLKNDLTEDIPQNGKTKGWIAVIFLGNLIIIETV